MERLEDRLALTTPTVVTVEPSPYDHSAAELTEISATFDQSINPSSVSDQTLAVHAMQSGRMLAPSSTLTTNGTRVAMAWDQALPPGQLVQATVTAGIQNAGGEGATPYVWQFRTASTGGSGFFEDSGQALGRAVGVSVALADLDGDGDLDLFAVGEGADEVWLNQGSGTFSSNGQSLGDLDSRDVALADLDGDGDQDAFVVGDGGNRVWINNGSGYYHQPSRSLGWADSTGVALGDLDGDGDIDALVVNAGENGAANKVWLNDGTGFFVDSGQQLGGLDSRAVALADLDGNGSLDAFVVNSGFVGRDPDKVWFNDGSGTFTDSGQALGNWSTLDVALADVDDDGDVDAVAVGETNRVWLNDGAGGFHDSGQTLIDATSRSVALADLDGDGDQDLYIAKSSELEGEPNQVWWNNGAGVFADSGQRLGDQFSTAVALGDVDGDGDTDALVGNGGTQPAANRVWKNNGSGTFTVSGQRLGFANTRQVALGDLNGDGRIDALVGNLGIANRVWFGDGRGNFFDSGQSLGSSDTAAVALGDLDGDGDLDAFVGNRSSQPNRIWINDGTGTFTNSGQSLGRSRTLDIALADLDGDGDLDAVTANGGSQASNVWLNDGHGSFSLGASTLGTRDSNAVAAGDLDRDGDLDVLITNWGAPNTIWWNNGAGVFTDSGQNLGNSNSWDVALGDVDNDGDLDAMVANRSHQADKIWLNNGHGFFSGNGQALGSGDSYAVTLGDLDGDGDLDAVTTGDEHVVWNNIGGVFSAMVQTPADGLGQSVALADVDEDGDLDAWLGLDANADRLWLNRDTPPVAPDSLEPNNTFQTATNLDARTSSLTDQLVREKPSLTIHSPTDADWFKWTAPEDGQMTAEALFSHATGDLDMWLFDSQQSQLDVSNSETDNESVTAEVTAGQTYYVKVAGFTGATQPDYDLIVRGSEYPPDRFEGDIGNDTIDTAADLGSASQINSGLTIHNPGNNDWYRFTPATSGTMQVEILFSHAQGDLDLHLGTPSGAELTASTTLTDNEQVTWDVTAGQSYLIFVEGFENATNPNYELRVHVAGDEIPPTVDIIDVAPDPRAGAVDAMTIVFSEPVAGLDLSDLTLRRFNDTTVSLLPGSATLSTSDNITWQLGNLAELTADSGAYELTLAPAGSGIEDLDGNALTVGATDRWTNGAGDANGDRNFNQLDLIQVLAVKKYLTGQPATWSEGDWNLDGIFNQLDVLLVQQTQPHHYLQGPFAATAALAVDPAEKTAMPVPLAAPAAAADMQTAPTLPVPLADETGVAAVTDAVFAAEADGAAGQPDASDGLAKSPRPDPAKLDLATVEVFFRS